MKMLHDWQDTSRYHDQPERLSHVFCLMGAGNISDRIYDGQCFFADPTVKFSGLAKWKGNLKLLVPFLVEPKIQLLKLEQDTQASSVLHVSFAKLLLQSATEQLSLVSCTDALSGRMQDHSHCTDLDRLYAGTMDIANIFEASMAPLH